MSAHQALALLEVPAFRDMEPRQHPQPLQLLTQHQHLPQFLMASSDACVLEAVGAVDVKSHLRLNTQRVLRSGVVKQLRPPAPN